MIACVCVSCVQELYSCISHSSPSLGTLSLLCGGQGGKHTQISPLSVDVVFRALVSLVCALWCACSVGGVVGFGHFNRCCARALRANARALPLDTATAFINILHALTIISDARETESFQRALKIKSTYFVVDPIYPKSALVDISRACCWVRTSARKLSDSLWLVARRRAFYSVHNSSVGRKMCVYLRIGEKQVGFLVEFLCVIFCKFPSGVFPG